MKRKEPRISPPARQADLEFDCGGYHCRIWWAEQLTANYYYASPHHNFVGYCSTQYRQPAEATKLWKDEDGIWCTDNGANPRTWTPKMEMPGQPILNAYASICT